MLGFSEERLLMLTLNIRQSDTNRLHIALIDPTGGEQKGLLSMLAGRLTQGEKLDYVIPQIKTDTVVLSLFAQALRTGKVDWKKVETGRNSAGYRLDITVDLTSDGDLVLTDPSLLMEDVEEESGIKNLPFRGLEPMKH